MPAIKLYDIVTNDDFELPLAYGLVGGQAAAEYLGISITTLWRSTRENKWSGKYKAIPAGRKKTSARQKALMNAERCRRYYYRKKEVQANDGNVFRSNYHDDTCDTDVFDCLRDFGGHNG